MERLLKIDTVLRCKICGQAAKVFDAIDSAKTCREDVYPLGVSGVSTIYHRCEDCGFIFTSDFDQYTASDWAEQIYNEDYIVVDPDYRKVRPLLTCTMIESQFSRDTTIGLDYGAGSGLMAATLRERGWTYDAYDPFGDVNMAPERLKTYNVCSAFEVFEHMVDPRAELARILAMCSPDKLMLVIGTNASDAMVSDRTRLSWWYAAPRNGHVSLFSKEALKRMAAQAGLDYASFGSSTHFLTRGWKPANVARMAYVGKMRRMLAKR